MPAENRLGCVPTEVGSIWTSCDFWTGRVDPDLKQIEHELTYRMGDLQLPIDLSVRSLPAKRGLWREPERSRRVVRLLFANWLAHVEHPGPDATPAGGAGAIPHRRAHDCNLAVSRRP